MHSASPLARLLSFHPLSPSRTHKAARTIVTPVSCCTVLHTKLPSHGIHASIFSLLLLSANCLFTVHCYPVTDKPSHAWRHGCAAQIRNLAADTEQEYEREKLNERVARLSGGVAIIQVSHISAPGLTVLVMYRTLNGLPAPAPWG